MWCLQNTVLQLFSAVFTLLFWYHIKKICVELEEYIIFTVITEIHISWTMMFRPDVHKKNEKIGNVAKMPDRLFGRIKSRNTFSKLSNINIVLAIYTYWTFRRVGIGTGRPAIFMNNGDTFSLIARKKLNNSAIFHLLRATIDHCL